ncbi:MAG: hypothetical protein ACTH1O_13215 [Brachybacterium sp.]
MHYEDPQTGLWSFGVKAGSKYLGASCVPTFVLEVESRLKRFVEQEDISQWHDGYEIRDGFSSFFLRDEGDGFVIEVPDFWQNPEHDRTEDLSDLWRIERRQAEIVAIAGRQQGPPVHYLDLVFGQEGWQRASGVQMTRDLSDLSIRDDGIDSGWFIQLTSGPEWADDALTVHPAWEALRINPGVANGFQLPEGFAVLVDDYRVSDVIDRASGDSLGAQTSPTT